jgi:hypothetical protein
MAITTTETKFGIYLKLVIYLLPPNTATKLVKYLNPGRQSSPGIFHWILRGSWEASRETKGDLQIRSSVFNKSNLSIWIAHSRKKRIWKERPTKTYKAHAEFHIQ